MRMDGNTNHGQFQNAGKLGEMASKANTSKCGKQYSQSAIVAAAAAENRRIIHEMSVTSKRFGC